MFCTRCGTQIDDMAKFCMECGAPITRRSNETPAVLPLSQQTPPPQPAGAVPEPVPAQTAAPSMPLPEPVPETKTAQQPLPLPLPQPSIPQQQSSDPPRAEVRNERPAPQPSPSTDRPYQSAPPQSPAQSQAAPAYPLPQQSIPSQPQGPSQTVPSYQMPQQPVPPQPRGPPQTVPSYSMPQQPPQQPYPQPAPRQYGGPAPYQQYPSQQPYPTAPSGAPPQQQTGWQQGAPRGMALMPQLAIAAQFRPGEIPVQLWSAGQEGTHYNSDDERRTHQLGGLLLATNQRLIFLVKKNILSKNYDVKESMDYGNIANWRVGQMMRLRSLEMDLFQGRDRRQVFHNLYELDPMTLKPVAPQTAQQLQELLGRLKRESGH